MATNGANVATNVTSTLLLTAHENWKNVKLKILDASITIKHLFYATINNPLVEIVFNHCNKRSDHYLHLIRIEVN